MRLPSLSRRQRRSIREVGGIVLGVLIALAIGEVADDIRWRFKVADTERVMIAELGGNRFNAQERLVAQPCIVRRLDEIGAILKRARQSGILPDVGEIDGPRRYGFERSAFEVAKSEGVALHMDRAQWRRLANAYNASADVSEAAAIDEQQAWDTLDLIENAPGPIGGDLLDALLVAWSHARQTAALRGRVAQQSDQALGELGVVAEYGAFQNPATLRAKVLSRPICKPLMVDGKPVR